MFDYQRINDVEIYKRCISSAKNDILSIKNLVGSFFFSKFDQPQILNKMKKITFTALLCLCLAAVSFAQKRSPREIADFYLKTRNAVVFTVKARSEAEALKVAQIVSIEHGQSELANDFSFKASAGAEDFRRFLKLGIPFEVQKSDNEIPQANTQRPPAGTQATMAWDTTWDVYPTYTEYVNKLNYWVTTYPNLCSLQNIGSTPNGRNIYILKISDNVTTDEGEPEFFYSSSMHGDEITGFPTMLHLIDYLLTNYNSGNAEAVNILNNVELFICPLANPDGSYKTTGNVTYNSTGNTPTRENSNGKDLNRNYPNWIVQGTTSLLHPDASVYQPETIAFMNWQKSRHLTMGANYHGGSQVMNYPWDGSATAGTTPSIARYSTHPHDSWWKLVAQAYATTCQAVSSTYMADVYAGQPAGITNGAAWYVILGGRQDYNNYFEHNKELTIECSTTKSPASSTLPNYWNYNRQAMLDYIKRCTYGLHGYVTDASGNPVRAKIYVSGQDTFGSWVQSSATVGDYHKLQIAGTYTVTFEAPGYTTQTQSVTLTNTAATTLNVTMVPVTSAPASSGATICEGNTASLTATGSGTFKWYTSANATTAAGSGSPFTTPALTTNTTYYVESEVALAALTTTAPSGGLTTAANMKGKYIIFSSTAPTRLKSVNIVAGGAGDIMVELHDSTGAMLQSKVMSVTGAGAQTLPLDFFIPTANNLRLVMRESNFTINKNTALGSTELSNTNITITGSSTASYFQFFYNWQFEPLKSNRTAVTVTVKPNQGVTGISPTSKLVNSGAFTLTVNGSNFRNGEMTVQWNGANRTTTFVSATQLTASILASDLATPGTANVTVLNTCNNFSTPVQTVSISCPAPVPTVTNLPTITAQCSTTLVAPTASSACAGTITGTTTSPTTYSAEGTYSVTWSYNDNNGNIVTQNQTVVIDDTTAPVPNVTNLPTISQSCSATLTAPTATDACAGTITGTTASPLTYSAEGTYSVTWTYNDGRGNTSTQNQTIVIDDTTAPVPNVSSLPTVTAQCSATLTAPTATDACAGTITGTTASPLTYSSEGSYTVTWSYNDGRGNTSTQNQTVVIDDTIAPVPTVSSLPTVTAQCSATLTAPTATDACAGTITGTTASQLTYSAEGSYTVTWSYNDGRGNTSTQNQTVVIDDTTAPVPAPSSLPALTGNCSVTLTAPTATDNCAGTVTATTTSPMTITTPGTYNVVWTYNDGRGNSVTRNQSVTVNNVTVSMTPGTTFCPGSVVAITATGNGSSYSWTSSTPGSLFTNAAATTAYTNQNVTTVYLKTSSTSTVTVTANGGPGCSNSTNQVFTAGSTTWNGAAWSNGVPNSSMAASFTGNYSSNGDLTACKLDVSNNAAVTVNDGHDFTILGPVTVATGSTLTLENNSNLLQNTGTTVNANSGNIVVKRNAKMWRQDYVYWGSPVTGQNVRDFSPMTLENRFYGLDEPTSSFKALFGTASATNYGYNPLTYNFIPAKGYMIRAPNDFLNPNYAQPQLQQTFNGEFTGVANDGTYTIPVTRSAGQSGYNLISNPYPSTVNAYDFLTTNPGTLYFWTHNNQTSSSGSNYATFTTLGGTPAATGGPTPNGTIQVGQGFLFVPSNAGTATFTNAMRSGNNQNQFFRSSANSNATSTEPGGFEIHRIWLNMSTGNQFLNQILIGYMTGATTTGLDYGIDGTQMNTGTSRMYSLIDDNTEYAIQGRAIPFVENDVVTMGYIASAQGSYTVSIDHVDGLFLGDQDIFVHDKVANVYHNLKESAYEFTSDAGTINDRLELVYQAETLGVDTPGAADNSILVYKAEGVLHVASSSQPLSNIQIFDVRGRKLYDRKDISGTSIVLSDLRAEQQVLLVTVVTESGAKVTRKVLY